MGEGRRARSLIVVNEHPPPAQKHPIHPRIVTRPKRLALDRKMPAALRAVVLHDFGRIPTVRTRCKATLFAHGLPRTGWTGAFMTGSKRRKGLAESPYYPSKVCSAAAAAPVVRKYSRARQRKVRARQNTVAANGRPSAIGSRTRDSATESTPPMAGSRKSAGSGKGEMVE